MLIAADHHIHTPLCKHATGELEAYVERGIALGLSAIGFADHNPLPRGLGAEARMAEAELEGYVNRVLELRSRYRGRINVLLGLEMDYIEGLESYLEQQVARHPFDYVLGAIHYLDADCRQVAWSQHYAANGDWLYRRYFELMRKLIRSGLCDILAHFDVPKRSGCPPTERQADDITRTLQEVARTGLCLEINTSGHRHPELSQPQPYPDLPIVEQALALGIPFTVNSDAHTPDQVGLKFPEMASYLQQRGCTRLAGFQHRQRV